MGARECLQNDSTATVHLHKPNRLLCGRGAKCERRNNKKSGAEKISYNTVCSLYAVMRGCPLLPPQPQHGVHAGKLDVVLRVRVGVCKLEG